MTHQAPTDNSTEALIGGFEPSRVLNQGCFLDLPPAVSGLTSLSSFLEQTKVDVGSFCTATLHNSQAY